MIHFNPFLTEGYISPEYFCDRTEETALLTEHLTNQRNVALIAKRRLGKSGLIHNCFHQPIIIDNYLTFYVDVYDTKNLAEFTYELGKSILYTLKPMGRKFYETFINVLKSLKASVTFDQNGSPEWSLSLGEIRTPDVMLDEIFYYLEHAEKPCLVAIDEFQVIADYPERTTEATLRKRIQNCHNVHFVYSGSKRHMMSEMFVSNARPFYNSAALMGLEPINQDAYFGFANRHLQTNGLSISLKAFHFLYDYFEGITWYIQYVLNILYVCKEDANEFSEVDVRNAIDTIVRRNAFAYRAMLYQLAPKQKEVLRAIASEGKVNGIMSKSFLSNHCLTSSAVQGAIKVLMDRDFVTREDGEYYVYDHFFELWLKS